jgi:hypothetical protein
VSANADAMPSAWAQAIADATGKPYDLCYSLVASGFLHLVTCDMPRAAAAQKANAAQPSFSVVDHAPQADPAPRAAQEPVVPVVPLPAGAFSPTVSSTRRQQQLPAGLVDQAEHKCAAGDIHRFLILIDELKQQNVVNTFVDG